MEKQPMDEKSQPPYPAQQQPPYPEGDQAPPAYAPRAAYPPGTTYPPGTAYPPPGGQQPPPGAQYPPPGGQYPPPGGQYPPPGGQYPPPQPGVVVTTVNVQALSYRDQPLQMQCPNCSNNVQTEIIHENGTLVWLLVLVIAFVFQLWCGCCLIPLCIEDVKDVRHTCPVCKYQLGLYKRI